MREFTEQEMVRREKLKNISNPYPEKFETNYEISEAKELEDGISGIRVAGRIILMRKMGKMAFLTIGDINGKNALVFDDEVDTAGSIMETVEVIKKFGAKDVYVGCTHGVLSDPAIERIKNSEIKELVMTNTIPLPPEKQISQIVVVSMSELFAEAIKRINEATSIGELFEAN